MDETDKIAFAESIRHDRYQRKPTLTSKWGTELIPVWAAGREEWDPDQGIQNRTEDFYCIDFFTKGHGIVELDGEVYDVHRNSLLFYGPGVKHSITPTQSSKARLSKYFVVMKGDRAKEIMVDRHDLQPGVYLPDRTQQFRNSYIGLFQNLIYWVRRTTKLSDDILSSLAHTIILMTAASRRAEPGKSARRRESGESTYRRCRECIDEKFMEFKTAQDAAEACGVSPEYLCHLFNRFADKTTPNKVLRQLRFAEADRLLESGWSVKAVANRLKLTPEYFSTRYKALSGGESPKKFQLRRQKEIEAQKAGHKKPE